MNVRQRRLSAALIFLSFFYLACGEALAAPDKYYRDRCRSAFDGNSEAAAEANKTTPLVMAVFGDSIMWGQGLKERDKFWCRAKQWVELKTGRHVEVELYAHAGAIIDEASLAREDHELALRIGEQGGEVNVSFPTINQQVERAITDFTEKRRGVDLVLIDGCINDVNFRNLLNAEKTKAEIESLTRSRCGKPMERLITRVASNFPRAYIFVTGYYPIVYQGLSDVEGGEKKQVVKGSANNQLTRVALKKLGGEGVASPHCKDDPRICLDLLSRTWYETSNGAIREAVEAVNRDLGGGEGPRIHFAEMYFPPEYGFSTKQSMLWNIRFGSTNVGGLRKWVAVGLDLFRVIDTNDDRWDERGRQCRATARAFDDRLMALAKVGDISPTRKGDLKTRLKYFEFVCRRGSLGHPNRFGAALYAQTVIGKLEMIIPETGWVATNR